MSKHKKLHYDALFFSPHLDDAVLSCGGLIGQLANQKKKVLVVTIFTAGQELAPMSQDATQFTRQSKAKNATTLFRTRKSEDRKALSLLDADFLHLEYIDALWRTTQNSQLYPSFEHIFSGKIDRHDLSMILKI